ncbi:MAG: 50S ribosomal protein L2 [Candidatus Omnitrophica bacterium]|nr:50S ribosomal protein L2 [Candidatus Omnitrophota bacterium]MDD5670926.1 50S ribosomal protein L2 [Candidatus Omnitrophota bacterium]
MGLIKFKPTTPTRRFGSVSDFADITADRPYRPLTEALRKHGGRNAHGHMTMRRRGRGHKQRYRIIDFRRNRFGVPAKVLTVEYDPNRTARIALIEYQDGIKSYILCPDGLKVGETVMSGAEAEVKLGNHLPLKSIPEGTPIHNIELRPGLGAKLVRSAGGVAQILSKENDFANVKLPSGEVRMIPSESYATVGQCSNIDNENIALGKAGRARWMGIRPASRGIAKNPVDHPMGGGEGKSKGGNHPQSPWGQKSKGLKTRKRYKFSNRFIVKDRRK